MKTISILCLVTLCLSCGYGTKQTTPPTAGTMPAIAALVPNSMNAGGGTFTLTVNGSQFGGNAHVNWNGTEQTTMVVTANQLTISVSNAMIAAPGVVSVTVTNPATGGGIYGGGIAAATSTPMTFTIN